MPHSPSAYEKTLDCLAERAYEIYENNDDPMSFVDFASHLVAKAAATEYDKNAADAAAFAASAHHVASIAEAAKFSGGLLSSKIKANDEKTHYTKLMQNPRKQPAPTPIKTPFHFEKTITTLRENKAGEEARTAFDKTYAGEKAKQAYLAACAIYPLASAAAYTSFIAASIATNQHPPQKRKEIFKRVMTSRLRTDLGYQPISPSLFIQIMSHHATCSVGLILLIFGIAALAAGVCAFTFPGMDAFLINLSISKLSLTVSAAAITLAGSSLLCGHFFAHHAWKKQLDASHATLKKMTMHNVS